MTTASDIAVSVKGLRKSYGGREVLKGIEFEVPVGEVFGCLGPNGAGKTTTIEILEGYRSRKAGEVSVLGRDPANPTRAWRSRIGLVLQECELEPTLTVRETVSMYAGYYPKPRSVDETIELVGLMDKANARIGRLSGGQARRADVALGIIGDPELIFLDEPTTGFDPSARRQAWKMIEGLKSLGKTIFLTTHYMDEAQHLADRVAILRAGEIVAVGSPEELGAHLGDRTMIRFSLPDGVDESAVRGEVGPDDRVDVTGNTVTVSTLAAQESLFRLLSWAHERDLALGGLEVDRPSLEDVFLDLVDGKGRS